MKYTILFADNIESDRQKWGAFLRESGYNVRLAATPRDARAELESSRIDLAIIDMRLEDDALASDFSGLELAIDKAFGHIPKIIFTGQKVPLDEQRKVWQIVGDEPPAVVAFVGKEEGPRVLLDEVRRAFEVWPRLNLLASKVSEQIKDDHRVIRSQAKWYFVASFVLSIAGFSLIILVIGIAFSGAMDDGLTMGVVGSAAGLILEALGYLFLRGAHLANQRMDLYHQELLQTYGVEFLLSVAERLPSARENACIEKMIYAVISSWYPRTTGETSVSLVPGDMNSEIKPGAGNP